MITIIYRGKITNLTKITLVLYASFITSSFLSCKKFIESDLNPSLVNQSSVFQDDNTATSAIIGIYYEMSTNFINTGTTNSIGRLAGLSGDELIDYSGSDASAVEFEENVIRPENINISNLWNSLYKVIYEANAMLEGLERSTGLSPAVKNQLLGEAKFIRAFCNFYLVNFFGNVPLVNATNYDANSLASRTEVSEVYEQIVTDLISAQSLMTDHYLSAERTRANSFAASALLAKAYLYLEDWANAEIQASALIANSNYEIVQELNSVFLKQSKEAIWQIAPIDPLNNTDEAMFYVPNGANASLVIRKNLIDSFDDTDLRLSEWIGTIDADGQDVYYPHKYKLQEFGLPTVEYSIVLRFSEQYLIRAEARANLNNLEGAISDLDVVRDRAGLSLIADENSSIDKESVLALIADERKKELFTEWGNRWFDLKRLNKAIEVLTSIKPDFTINDMLYPLPQIELDRNPNLGEQNIGY